jgi:hypothetical protein
VSPPPNPAQETAGFGAAAGREDITALAEFVGCSFLAFCCSLSRLHPPSCLEGWEAGVSSARTLAEFRLLGSAAHRLARRSFGKLSGGDARVPKAVLHFMLRFLLSMALGAYTPTVDHVIGERGGTSQSHLLVCGLFW